MHTGLGGVLLSPTYGGKFRLCSLIPPPCQQTRADQAAVGSQVGEDQGGAAVRGERVRVQASPDGGEVAVAQQRPAAADQNCFGGQHVRDDRQAPAQSSGGLFHRRDFCAAAIGPR